MHFVLIYRFLAAAAPQRASLRPAHGAYVDSLGEALVEAGPLLDENDMAIGTLLLVTAPDLETARRIGEDDPYAAFRTSLEVFAYTPVFVGGKRV